MRNSNHKEQIKGIHLNKALKILREPPFSYSESICQDVANDILDHGAQLQTNSMEEDDEDAEMNELNNMGVSFTSKQQSVLLYLTVDKREHEDFEKRVEALFPMPTEPRYNIKRHSVSTLPECLEKLKSFINYTATRAFSATIVILGHLTQDGVRFDNGTTIPRQILEQQAISMLNSSDELTPLTLDMVILEGSTVHVTSLPRSVSERKNEPSRMILTEG